jgi:hypothetical protein
VVAQIVNGHFTITLCANSNAMPANTSYSAKIQIYGGGTTQETWVVPSSPSPTNLAGVRTSPTPIPSFLVNLSQIVTSLTGVLYANGSTVTNVTGTLTDCVKVNGTSGACGGGGGTRASGTGSATATSITITHNFGTATHQVVCYTTSGSIPVIPASYGLGTNTDTPTFPGGLLANTTCVAE